MPAIDSLDPSTSPADATTSPEPWEPQDRELKRSNLFRDSGTLLALTALALLAAFLFAVLGSFLPPRLLDPAWQLRLIDLLIGSSPFPLIAVGLLLIGAQLDEGNTRLERWFLRCRAWARFACVGYILLVPLQLAAMGQMGQRVEFAARRPIDAMVRSRQAIAASGSLEELNRALRELPGAPQLPATMEGSMQRIRADAQRQLGARISQLEAEARSQRQRLRFNEVMTALRMIAMSLLLAVVFGAMAMRHPERGSWLEQIRRQRQQRRQRRWQRRLEAAEQEEDLAEAARHHQALELELERQRQAVWISEAEPGAAGAEATPGHPGRARSRAMKGMVLDPFLLELAEEAAREEEQRGQEAPERPA